MKRVYCLYRVSTREQAEGKIDIPMQRAACRQYAQEQDWTILKEFSEVGVSGYKTKIENRKELYEILNDATKRLFDTLLVFMFDRIGRQMREVDVFISALHCYDIEIWSMKEGQLQNNESGELIQNIRYWSAQMESRHTSMRVDTRLKQLVAEGKFRGGAIPYGYRLVRIGEHPSYNILTQDPQRVEAVKIIFECYTQGQSVQEIISCLTERGFKPKGGGAWKKSSIYSILRNRTYTGHLKYGEILSPFNETLCIVSEEVFDRAQAKLKRQSGRGKQENQITNYRILCSECNAEMVLRTTEKSYLSKDGISKHYRKICYFCKQANHPAGYRKYFDAISVNSSIVL